MSCMSEEVIDRFIKMHKELEEMNSLQLLSVIIYLNKLTAKLQDLLLKKIIEEARRQWRPKNNSEKRV